MEEARGRLQQAGNRGDVAEHALRQFLSTHLPRAFDVGHGEVIDSFGERSRQMDVVITTPDHPYRHPSEEPGMFIVEGVLAAAEVKTRLTAEEVRDAVQKAASFKKLRKHHLSGSEVFANPSTQKRWVEGPSPFFVFAYESEMAVSTLLDMLSGLASDAWIDAIFVLGRGAAVDYGDGQGTLHIRLRDGTDVTGWAWAEGQPSVLSLLTWLHSLPRVMHRQSPYINYLGGTGLTIYRPGGSSEGQ